MSIEISDYLRERIKFHSIVEYLKTKPRSCLDYIFAWCWLIKIMTFGWFFNTNEYQIFKDIIIRHKI